MLMNRHFSSAPGQVVRVLAHGTVRSGCTNANRIDILYACTDAHKPAWNSPYTLLSFSLLGAHADMRLEIAAPVVQQAHTLKKIRMC